MDKPKKNVNVFNSLLRSYEKYALHMKVGGMYYVFPSTSFDLQLNCFHLSCHNYLNHSARSIKDLPCNKCTKSLIKEEDLIYEMHEQFTPNMIWVGRVSLKYQFQKSQTKDLSKAFNSFVLLTDFVLISQLP